MKEQDGTGESWNKSYIFKSLVEGLGFFVLFLGGKKECTVILLGSKLISIQQVSTLNDKEFHCHQREIAADLRPLFGN